MSKTPRRKSPARKRSAGRDKARISMNDETKRRWLVVLAVTVLAGLPFVLGKYFEFNSPGAFDSGAYVYSAQHVLSGSDVRVGHEEKASAQAGTLLVNMLGVKLFGFGERGSEILQMLLQAGALAFMFITIRRLYGTLAGGVSVTVASVYLSAPLIAKFGNVKEQFMIAFMILGICCFVFYQLQGKWWWAVLAGATLVWGPMFKQTGMSAIGAVTLFVLVQPLLHHTLWKRAGRDILLLVAGGVAVLVPICTWYVSMQSPVGYWPYGFILKPMVAAFHSGEARADEGQQAITQESVTRDDESDDSLFLKLMPFYVRDAWKALGPAQRQAALQRPLRYYRLLILPIVLALGAIVLRALSLFGRQEEKRKNKDNEDTAHFVLLFAVWWLLDMAFVWISPRSYEQYYLPLNASAAMLGGYLVGAYERRLQGDCDRTRWIVLGLVGVLLMMVMSWHIFFGIAKSPHSGVAYRDRMTQELELRRGYLQKWRDVAAHPSYDWKRVGQYIREHSEPTDKIYVWGWVPGIYVEAQRLSPTSKAFEGQMHTLAPAELTRRVKEILAAFEKEPPAFIVDTRKSHFPWDRPPLELWPKARFKGMDRARFLPDSGEAVAAFDKMYHASLAKQIGADEAQRYEAMEPFRRYVMKNYQIVSEYGAHVLFRRK
ncbi:MAG: glycosyltransferase family 39 protein [Sedimentisphaerales bacterium]|nr:glycosyltransferase family 39 protein [Sedimentisphaerales bacterium]